MAACVRPACVSLLLLPPDPRRHDRRRARRGARGLGPDHPPRRRGAGRRGRPDLRGARPARRHPPDRRLPHPAHRHDHRRGRRAVPVRASRVPPRSSGWARSSPRRGSRSSPRSRRSCAAARAGCSSGSTSTPRGWFRAGEAVPHLATIAECVWEGRRIELDYDRGDTLVTRRAGPAGPRAQGGHLVPRRRARRPAAHLPRVARPWTSRAAEDAVGRGRPASTSSAYWAESIAAYEREAPRIEVTVRVRRDARSRWLEDMIDAPVARQRDASSPDPDPDVAAASR